MDGRLAGRTVVVTGAGRGLGLAIARAAGAAGARIIVAERDEPRGKDATRLLEGEGIDAQFVAMDVADERSVQQAAEIITAEPIWGLVNNAALASAVGGKRFHEISVAEWDDLMAVNARGPWLVSRAFVPSMIAAGAGRILNLASDTALFGLPRLAHYIASKGAVMALTRAMAREVGDDGITVNAIAPGLTESESTEGVPAERHRFYADVRAITRPQTPDDIVGAAVFLLSDESAFITGQTLVIDGGFVMR